MLSAEQEFAVRVVRVTFKRDGATIYTHDFVATRGSEFGAGVQEAIEAAKRQEPPIDVMDENVRFRIEEK